MLFGMAFLFLVGPSYARFLIEPLLPVHTRGPLPPEGPGFLAKSNGAWTLLLALLAAPVAWYLWLIRDKNRHAEFISERLAELRAHFYELQGWATDSANPARQSAALFQLRDFLRGGPRSSPPEMAQDRRLLARQAREFFEMLLRNRSLWSHTHRLVGKDGNYEPEFNLAAELNRETLKTAETEYLDGGSLSEEARSGLLNMAEQLKAPDPDPDPDPVPEWGRAQQAVKAALESILVTDGFRLLNLRGANLEHFNLSGANLAGVDLTGANLYRAELSSANLGGTRLNDTQLSSAVLVRANLAQANLSGGQLVDAKLMFADLSESNLAGALFSGQLWLLGANIDRAKIDEENEKHFRRCRGAPNWIRKGSNESIVPKILSRLMRPTKGDSR